MREPAPAAPRRPAAGHPPPRAGRRRRRVALAVLIAVAPWWAGADPAHHDERSAASATDLSPAGQELVRDTWPQRIEGSGYYELVDELRRLGLDDRGTRAELEARLRQFHGLPAPSLSDAEPSRVVEVRRAERAEYATLAETGTDSVTLRGAVEVAVLETDPATVHVIGADQVIYDRTAQLLTARGAVHYQVTQEEGEPQSVHAATMAFDLGSSKAVFLSATTRQRRDGATGPLTFSFTADVITRLSDATIILDDVRFTSSPDPLLPNYEIHARRMWLLAPGEWGLQAATIHVGRVPVFYVPFFFWPGDEVVFHPAVGVRDREGLFLNTTLYLIGRRPREDEPFSVLGLTDPGDYREQLRGIFLRKIPGHAPPPDDHYLKLMLDLYARLGMFAGAAGMLPAGDGGEVNFQVGAARSRNIFFDSARGTYTAYDQSGRSHWHGSTLFGSTVPLRYGVEFSADVRFPQGSVRAALELFSDPEFVRDFGNRQERFDWPTLIGFPGDPDAPPARRSNLTWEIVARADLSEQVAADRSHSRVVEQLRLTNAGVRWFWQSRADPTVPVIDPTRSFYYPASLRLQTAAQVDGTLLQLPSTPTPANEPAPAAVPGRGLRAFDAASDRPQGVPPLPSDQPGQSGTSSVVVRLPSLLRELRSADVRAPRAAAAPPVPTAAAARVGYRLSPGVTVEGIYGSDDWKRAVDVDHAMQSITLRADQTTRLDRRVDLFGGLITFDSGLRHSLTLLQPQRGPALVDDGAWETLRRDSLRRSRTSLQLDNRFTLRPLSGVPDWENSSIVYDLDLRLVNVVYDATRGEHRPRWGVWNMAGVPRHRLETVAEWRLGNLPQRLTLAGDLPPRPLHLSARLDLDGGFLSATTAVGARCPTMSEPLGECSDLTPDPLSITARATPLEWLSLSERVTIDLIRSQFERSESTLRAGGLGASLIARRDQPGDPLQVRQLRLDYADTFGPDHLWRNRVAVRFAPQANWTVDVIDPKRSRLTFTTALTLGIHEFLDLSFGTVSSNDNTYCYVPAWADASCSTRNPLEDLYWSLAFWNENQRRQSNFKADRISVSAVHHLQDWDLTFELEARPVPQKDGFSEFQSRFSIFLQWLPVPEIRSNVGGDGDSFFIDESFIEESSE